MQLSVFTDLCLICANYDCEQESSHKKYSLYCMEKLLAQYFLLEVSRRKKYEEIYVLNTSSNNCQTQPKIVRQKSQNDRDSAINDQKSLPLFIDKILQILENRIQQKEQRINNFSKILLASLSTVFCLQNFDSDPLSFHDILYVIKMITMYKYRVSQKTIAPENLPFTHKRIKRMIKMLQKKIIENSKTKDQERSKFQQNNRSFSQFILKDITNQVQKERKNPDSVETQDFVKDTTKNYQTRLVIDRDIRLRNLAEQLKIIFQENKILESEIAVYFIYRLLSQIEKIQQNLSDGIQNSEMKDKVVHKNKLHRKQKNNNEQKININQTKSTYPIFFNDQKQIQTNDFQQEAESIQFTFIQGVPFPKNRRSVDFSVLQITDQILFSYLPSLQKLKDLEQLCIRKNRLSNLGYKLLKNTFPKLRSLDVRQNLITREICQFITQFKLLNILYISQCRISSKSLVQICLKLPNINVLYCDNLVLLEDTNKMIPFNFEDSDLRGIFYIIALNLKKLMYLSIKGYFSPQIIDQMFRNNLICSSICLSQLNEGPQLKIFKNIYQILQKRHGIVQI